MQTDLLCGPFPHRIVGTCQPPGQMGVEALDTPAGPPHPARGSWAHMVGGDERVAVRRVARMGLGDPTRGDRSLGEAAPPDDSIRLTASRRVGSTNQNRVGMWVPSYRKGALAMTAGLPSSLRTTISNSPAGV